MMIVYWMVVYRAAAAFRVQCMDIIMMNWADEREKLAWLDCKGTGHVGGMDGGERECGRGGCHSANRCKYTNKRYVIHSTQYRNDTNDDDFEGCQ